jgi:hypothetical protein
VGGRLRVELDSEGEIGLQNYFSKINRRFSVKGKRFYINYYFTSRQISVNAENIFYKLFYDETNGI